MAELVVVVAIILLVLAAALPSLSSVWNQRKAAEAETLVRGAVTAARMKALNKTERGLLFTLDDKGRQVVYEIQAEPFDVTDPGDVAGADEESTANRFRVLEGTPLHIPEPYRIAPRSIVDPDPPGSTPPPWLWDDPELIEQDYRAQTATHERHRNFFTIIFTPDGQLRVNRDAIIHDQDGDPAAVPPIPQDGLGDLTRLTVGTNVKNWDDGTATGVALSTDGTLSGLMDVMVNTSSNDAINFRSVDGLLVYDDSLFAELTTPDEKRDLVLKTAQPLYISRLSGAVVLGPAGENQ